MWSVADLKRSAKNPLARAVRLGHCHFMQEEDGRWIAEVPVLRGALAYGASKEEAIAKVEVLVLRAIADKLEHGEEAPEVSHVFTVAA